MVWAFTAASMRSNPADWDRMALRARNLVRPRRHAVAAVFLAVAASASQAVGVAQSMPAEPSTIRVDAPLTTLTLSVANDDPTNAIMCGLARLTGDAGRITFYPHSLPMALTGRLTDSARDLVFLDGSGLVVATISDLAPSPTSGGPAQRPSGIYAKILIEVAPAEIARSGITPGSRVFLPRHVKTGPVPTALPPCVRTIR